jgi:2-isopropylmalate synthase
VDLDVNGTRLWGVGIDGNTSIASLKAIVSAVNRAIRAEQSAPKAESELIGA